MTLVRNPRCRSLIASLARGTIDGCEVLGLRPFTREGDDVEHIPTLLIEAWEQFRADPAGYGPLV